MKKIILAGLAAVSLAGAAAPALAAPGDRREDRQDRREFRQDQRQDRREFRQDMRQDRRDFQRAQRRYHAGAYNAPRGYVYRSWSVGQRLPRDYYGSRYVIRDYRDYGLYAPPRGYQWTRVGNDAVLTALTTGVIGAIIGGLFF